MPLFPLDIDRLLRETSVAQVQHFASVGSTNDTAKQLAAGEPGVLPLLVVAEEQTAGRGRGANRWWTGPGSLAFSLLLETAALGLRREQSPLVALAAGVAVRETVARRLPQHPVGLHWPNDVYVEGRKVAGILVELPRPSHLVLGIGLNTNNTLADAPESLRDSATTLRDLSGSLFDPTEILVELLQTLDQILGQLPDRPEAIAQQANAWCVQREQPLTVEQGTRLVQGTCTGIADDGSLVLQTDAGVQRIYSGVVRG